MRIIITMKNMIEEADLITELARSSSIFFLLDASSLLSNSSHLKMS
jgi:hypothetical protein